MKQLVLIITLTSATENVTSIDIILATVYRNMNYLTECVGRIFLWLQSRIQIYNSFDLRPTSPMVTNFDSTLKSITVLMKIYRCVK